MVPYWMSRTQLMLGEESTGQLMNKNVIVVGLGGVGGICAEMIARAGIGKMTIADGDVVDLSNCNRQIAALHSTEKQSKGRYNHCFGKAQNFLQRGFINTFNSFHHFVGNIFFVFNFLA